MEKFHNVTLNKKDHFAIDAEATVARVLLTPVALLVKIYCWVWDIE